MPSLNVSLEPGKTVTVKLVKAGYITQEFSYTVPSAPATVTKTLAPTPTPPCDSYGDVDDDGYVTQADADLIKLYVFGGWAAVRDTVSISESEFVHRADVDGNGYVNMGDVGAIYGYIGGTIDTFPVCTKGALYVTTTPTGASVKVGAETKTSPCTFTLAPGTHTVTITKAGYTTKTDTVAITAGVTTSKSYTLTAATGTLSVTTSPTGASVKVGVDVKTSPCNFTLAPGTYTVTISKTGYDTITDSVTITSGVTTSKSYTLTPSKGTLSVTTSPTGASVKVVSETSPTAAGETKTSPCTFSLAPGTYAVTITKTHYDTITDIVTITSGVTTTRSYKLTPTPGTLAITTMPTGATVKLGAETKTSPCNFTLASGAYTVTVSKSGYDTITDSITITAGETTTKSYTLARSEVTITFKTLKEDTTELTGVDVWIDGVKKGTT